MNKVEKIKKLADAMYNRMQNLTTDTSGIRKAMDEYHQFIINEYYKEDTEKDFGIKSNDLEEAAIEAFKQIVDSDKNNFLEIFKAGVEWQKDTFIEKTCEFFSEHLWEYINIKNANCDTFINIDGDKLKEDFKKYMKGE